ncbi:MAG: AgmX/PglI C-terminal domain-containing protein [Proteobacteria bacterium]|nr:AgmX/PglI C-terminal domain-containing protein [Pseudomonadota bacterium]
MWVLWSSLVLAAEWTTAPVGLPVVENAVDRPVSEFVWWSAGDASSGTVKKCAKGKDVTSQLTATPALVEITPGAVSFGGQVVTALQDGAIPPSALEGQYLAALGPLLKAADDAQVALSEQGCQPGEEAHPRLLVVADARVPFGVARTVMATAAQAGTVRDVALAARDAYPSQPGSPSGSEVSTVHTAVHVSAVGLKVVGNAPRLRPDGAEALHLPCEGDCTTASYDWAGLSELAAAVKADFPGERFAVLVPDVRIPVAAVGEAVDALAPSFAVVLAGSVGQDGDEGSIEEPIVADERPVVLDSEGMVTVLPTSLPTMTKGFGTPIKLGSLDRELINEPIAAQIGTIQRCYAAELARTPNLAGKVVLKFVISADGTVGERGIKSSELGHEGVESCILDVIGDLVFAKPKGGGVVMVSYPFLFAPQTAD